MWAAAGCENRFCSSSFSLFPPETEVWRASTGFFLGWLSADIIFQIIWCGCWKGSKANRRGNANAVESCEDIAVAAWLWIREEDQSVERCQDLKSLAWTDGQFPAARWQGRLLCFQTLFSGIRFSLCVVLFTSLSPKKGLYFQAMYFKHRSMIFGGWKLNINEHKHFCSACTNAVPWALGCDEHSLNPPCFKLLNIAC